MREERTLVRRQRMTEEASGEGQSWIIKVWLQIEVFVRPLKLIGEILILLIMISIWSACFALDALEASKAPY